MADHPDKPKEVRKNPNLSAVWNAIWADPERSAAMVAKREATIKKRGSRRNDRILGLTYKQADRARVEARKQAKKLIALMEEEGHFPEAVVPGTDDAKAKAALEATCEIGLTKGINLRDRLTALKTVLEFTKKKPASDSNHTFKSEDWLNAVVSDVTKDDA